MAHESSLTVHRLRCEYRQNPIGIDVTTPRLSWQLASAQRGAVQTSYEIQVANNPTIWTAGDGLLWDSGRVGTDASIQIPYDGPVLRSMQRVYWRVRAWDSEGIVSPWSEVAFWEMGLLAQGDWLAKWIEPDWAEDPETARPCPYLRAEFTVQGSIKQARAYITSHGLYEMSLNGAVVSEDIFTLGWTAYEKRLQYQVYDVTALLQTGDNAIGVILGDGWWRGKIGVAAVPNAYGTTLALLVQLRIQFEDGTEQWFTTDESWKANTGPILASDLKDGEVYDARLEMPGWNRTGYDTSSWKGVRVAEFGYGNLVASNSVPVRRKERISPVAILRTPNGETVVDMGQNLAGRVQMKVRGTSGTTIAMQHGEVLDKLGNFTMSNLAMPKGMGSPIDTLQKVTYICKGDGEEVYEPRFTFHGFRYVRVVGFPSEPTPENFTSIAIYSDMEPTSQFVCSDPLINQLNSNMLWSQKSNFLDIPTDCPQRERAGWTGDAQIYARTGSTLMDTAAFFTKWLQDLATEQHDDGMVTNLVPDAFKKAGGFLRRLEGSAGWGDAAVIVPWTMYQCFGDTRVLEAQYASMKAWVDYEAANAENTHWVRKLQPSYWFSSKRRERMRYVWDTRYHWGEWLEPGSKLIMQFLGIFRRLIFGAPEVATAYFAYSAGLLAHVAGMLGKADDSARYRELSERAKAAYTAEFSRRGNRLAPDRQATYVRALALELIPEEKRPAAAQRLAELVRQNGNHLSTGFLSTVFLLHILTRYGYLDVAYDLLNQKTVPSWLYPITKGATSIWETWDGIREDGSVQASHNHYSYGAVGSWLYQVVAGIDLDPDLPGYKRIIIHPRPGGGLSTVRAAHDSIHGRIISGWRLEGDQMHMEVEIPANTSAIIHLPGARVEQAQEGGVLLTQATGISNVRQLGTEVICEAGGGQYVFEFTRVP